ncbi:uncharacterized protein EAE98_004602 [Botrytis deweyae]|uniref:Uncharacterized protein n=1 Tax=Botrytis deweyae TaxID=2478750 RepID=A0ABQ7IRF9_9HELO|nr:uncharacterized protein EAE98_004602 [Botrytis deweyae]KAF7931866.1 hypothetical protein EAE98_004602 [Botrytis deweyae]
MYEATDNVRRSTRAHENGCLHCLHCMKPDDYYFPPYDFHEFEGCRKRYIKADRDFEQQESFPNVRFVQEIFTPGLLVFRNISESQSYPSNSSITPEVAWQHHVYAIGQA